MDIENSPVIRHDSNIKYRICPFCLKKDDVSLSKVYFEPINNPMINNNEIQDVDLLSYRIVTCKSCFKKWIESYSRKDVLNKPHVKMRLEEIRKTVRCVMSL